MTIRTFKMTDLPWLVKQLKDFADFYGTKKSLFLSATNTESLLKNLGINHVMFVAEKDGELQGFIAGYFNPHPYNPEIKVLNEAFFWVEPNKRGSRAAIKLLDRFVGFGKRFADFVSLTLEDESQMSEKHFIKRGFKLKERNFLLECD